jgi:hypothetical protein
MGITFRNELKSDEKIVEEITKRTFCNLYEPCC